MMPIKKFPRAAVLLWAAVITIITGMVVANAVQTITTPNAVFVSYNLGAGLSAPPIAPSASKAVLVMGVCNTAGTTGFFPPLPKRGVGQVTLLRTPAAGIRWTGLESPPGANITTGVNDGVPPGAHIVDISGDHLVDIVVAGTDTIRVHNSSGEIRTGNVTLIW